MAGIRAGELTDRITFRRLVLTPDGSGQKNPSGDETIATVWCRATPRSSAESFSTGQVQSRVIWDVDVRAGSHLNQLHPKGIAILHGQWMEILSIRPGAVGFLTIEVCQRTDGKSIREAAAG